MKGDKCTKSMFPDDLYEDNYVHDKALELLRRRPTNAPFFLHVSFPGPHPPFLVTPVQYDAVDHRSFPPPVDGSSSTPEVCVSTGQPQTSNSDRCDYAAEMENLDRLVGSLLDELFAQGVTESTLVCFASDHGEMLGDHGQVGKGKPWEASASVPLACAGPGVTRGAIESRAVATLDLAATFLDYAGVHPSGYPEGMTSISLRPLLERGHPLGADETATPPPPPLPREYVQSGLQSKPFNTTLTRDLAATPVQTDPVHTQGPVHTQADGWSWRMVVEATTGLKLVCCRGRCPGAPSTIPPLNQTTGYQQVLLNMSQDRYDMHPIQDEVAAARLRARLPKGFRCGGEVA
jgi:arylsulfatase A-like enzyme